MWLGTAMKWSGFYCFVIWPLSFALWQAALRRSPWLALSLTVLWLTTTTLFGAQLLAIILDLNDNWLSLALVGVAWFAILGVTNMAWRSWLKGRRKKKEPAGNGLRGRVKARARVRSS